MAGYRRLAIEGRAPAWHHHAGKPLLASLAMVPGCLLIARWHAAPAILGGAVVYVVVLAALGGLPLAELRRMLGCRTAEA